MTPAVTLVALTLGPDELHAIATAPLAPRTRAADADDPLAHLALALDQVDHPWSVRRIARPARVVPLDLGEHAALEWVTDALAGRPDALALSDLPRLNLPDTQAEVLFRELLVRAILGDLAIDDPTAASVAAVVPLDWPLPLRAAFRAALVGTGFRSVLVLHPPEASLARHGVGRRAGPFEFHVAGEEGVARIPGHVDHRGAVCRIALGESRHAAGAVTVIDWEPRARAAAEGALALLALEQLGRVEIAAERRWHLALSIDGQALSRLSLLEHKPGARVGLASFAVELPAPRDPALVLHAGLHPSLPATKLVRCGALRINRHRLAEGRGQVVGQVEWIAGQGVSWGWFLPETGDLDKAALPVEAFS